MTERLGVSGTTESVIRRENVFYAGDDPANRVGADLGIGVLVDQAGRPRLLPVEVTLARLALGAAVLLAIVLARREAITVITLAGIALVLAAVALTRRKAKADGGEIRVE